MVIEDMKKIINDIIENEFKHICEFEEKEDFDCNNEISLSIDKVEDLLQELCKIVPNHQDLLMNLDSRFMDYCINACRYYFKKGVISGITNLKFLENIETA